MPVPELPPPDEELELLELLEEELEVVLVEEEPPLEVLEPLEGAVPLPVMLADLLEVIETGSATAVVVTVTVQVLPLAEAWVTFQEVD